MTKCLDVSDVRKMEEQTMEMLGIGNMDMIRCAASATTEHIIEYMSNFCAKKIHWHVVTGGGKNAADSFYIGKYLLERGFTQRIVFHCKVAQRDLKDEALEAYRDVSITAKGAFFQDSLDNTDFDLPGMHVVIDALLGTGLSGNLRPGFGEWIACINRAKATVLSVDVPSGLNAQTGTVCGNAVRADLTLTMGVLKPGLLTKDGPKHCGKIICVDIGVPREVTDSLREGEYTLIDRDYARTLLQKVRFDAYKQSRGHVVVIGGSADYPSAPLLSAEAALRAGAGLVTVVLPGGTELIAGGSKALIVRKTPSTKGHFSLDDVAFVTELLKGKSAAVIGPGMTTHAETREFFRAILPSLTMPKVLDADALNILAESKVKDVTNAAETVFTPHAGEMARLLASIPSESGDELQNAKTIASAFCCNCLHKGPYSVCCDASGKCSRNLSGSPALATAGSGDVLSGIIAAFLAQRYNPFEALQLAVWLHGSIPESLRRTPDIGFPCGITADDLIHPGIRLALNDLAGLYPTNL